MPDRALNTQTPAKGTIESRRTPRRVFERLIGILHHATYSVESAVQLSEGGLLFYTVRKMEPDDILVISLLIPGGAGAMVLRGHIVYEMPKRAGAWRYGVKFDDITLLNRRLIRNYVSLKTQEEAEREAQGAN